MTCRRESWISWWQRPLRSALPDSPNTSPMKWTTSGMGWNSASHRTSNAILSIERFDAVMGRRGIGDEESGLKDGLSLNWGRVNLGDSGHWLLSIRGQVLAHCSVITANWIRVCIGGTGYEVRKSPLLTPKDFLEGALKSQSWRICWSSLVS